MTKEFCIMGVENSIYTKIVVNEFKRRNIEYDLILEKRKNLLEENNLLNSIALRFSSFIVLLNSGRFKALSKTDLFTYIVLIKYLYNYYFHKPNFRKDNKYEDLKGYFVPNINHCRTLKYLKKKKYKFGVIAGVGIIDELIISAFKKNCINAHPGPLPECPGAGALEQTLYKGLDPAVSVHFALSKVDSGEIIKSRKIKIFKSDTFFSFYDRLTLNCGIVLAEVCEEIAKGKTLKSYPNNGSINYWSNCNKNIQKNAWINFKKLQANLEYEK